MTTRIPHKWKCKCLECGVWRSQYWKQHRQGLNLFVPADEARKYLRTFTDSVDAARVLRVHQTTLCRIMKGRTKRIRKSTEQRILDKAA